MPDSQRVAILCGGGPAPGINSVIGAATIRAIVSGVSVVGIRDGFKWLMQGDTSCAVPLSIDAVSRIHFTGGSYLGISRANPTKDERHLEAATEALGQLGVDKLISIGGDDTAYSAMRLAEHAGGRLRVVHVPKTIDNDLDLPHGISTFGFQTARHVGVELVKNLMVDARTTSRWYLVVAMGRKAGHLALGIGKAAGATLTVIPEEFGSGPIRLNHLVDSLAGVNLADVVKHRLRDRLAQLGLNMTLVTKDIGYELRCADPIPFDMEYTRDLGYCAAQYLLDGGSNAMVTLVDGRFSPIPFDEMLDPQTGRTRVRLVDTSSEQYQIARRYMVRLRHEDLDDPRLLAGLASVVAL